MIQRRRSLSLLAFLLLCLTALAPSAAVAAALTTPSTERIASREALKFMLLEFCNSADHNHTAKNAG